MTASLAAPLPGSPSPSERPAEPRRSRSRVFTGQADLDPTEGLTPLRSAVLTFSWVAIVLLGLAPLLEELYHRPYSAAAPATLAFAIAISSAAILRHHYSWLGAALHIAGQVMIWLSIFSLTIAALIF